MSNEKKESEWTDRDWKWLCSYFISAIILLLANYYLGWKTDLTIVASAASITLAVLAIFLTLKQDTDNKMYAESKHAQLFGSINELGNRIQENDRVIMNVSDSVNTEKEVIDRKEAYTYEQLIAYGEKIKHETIQTFEKELEKNLLNEFKNINNSRANNRRDRENEIILLLTDKIEDYTIPEVANQLKNYGIYMTESVVRRRIEEITKKRKL